MLDLVSGDGVVRTRLAIFRFFRHCRAFLHDDMQPVFEVLRARIAYDVLTQTSLSCTLCMLQDRVIKYKRD